MRHAFCFYGNSGARAQQRGVGEESRLVHLMCRRAVKRVRQLVRSRASSCGLTVGHLISKLSARVQGGPTAGQAPPVLPPRLSTHRPPPRPGAGASAYQTALQAQPCSGGREQQSPKLECPGGRCRTARRGCGGDGAAQQDIRGDTLTGRARRQTRCRAVCWPARPGTAASGARPRPQPRRRPAA